MQNMGNTSAGRDAELLEPSCLLTGTQTGTNTQENSLVFLQKTKHILRTQKTHYWVCIKERKRKLTSIQKPIYEKEKRKKKLHISAYNIICSSKN